MLVLTVRLKTGLFVEKDELARVIEEVEGFDQVMMAAQFKSSQRNYLLSYGKRLCQIMEKCLKGKE